MWKGNREKGIGLKKMGGGNRNWDLRCDCECGCGSDCQGRERSLRTRRIASLLGSSILMQSIPSIPS